MEMTKPDTRPKVYQEREFPFTTADFNKIRGFLYQHAGISLADHKTNLVYNRLVRRVRTLKLSSFAKYFDYLESSDAEFVHFINAMTTNLTSFYREAHHFEYLSEVYLPQLAKAGKRELKIWSSACSVGEEPYSIGISLLESGINFDNWHVDILATDIDTNVLSVAERAIYPIERVDGLSDYRRKLGFYRGKGSQKGQVIIKPEIRNWVRFASCNLMETWPVTEKVDIIFCRNVMIYFDKPTQNALLERMEYILKPGGLLCIGHSESPARDMSNFRLLGRTMYQKIGSRQDCNGS